MDSRTSPSTWHMHSSVSFARCRAVAVSCPANYQTQGPRVPSVIPAYCVPTAVIRKQAQSLSVTWLENGHWSHPAGLGRAVCVAHSCRACLQLPPTPFFFRLSGFPVGLFLFLGKMEDIRGQNLIGSCSWGQQPQQRGLRISTPRPGGHQASGQNP